MYHQVLITYKNNNHVINSSWCLYVNNIFINYYLFIVLYIQSLFELHFAINLKFLTLHNQILNSYSLLNYNSNKLTRAIIHHTLHHQQLINPYIISNLFIHKKLVAVFRLCRIPAIIKIDYVVVKPKGA
jgi:hypothetical protein